MDNNGVFYRLGVPLAFMRKKKRTKREKGLWVGEETNKVAKYEEKKRSEDSEWGRGFLLFDNLIIYVVLVKWCRLGRMIDSFVSSIFNGTQVLGFPYLMNSKQINQLLSLFRLPLLSYFALIISFSSTR